MRRRTGDQQKKRSAKKKRRRMKKHLATDHQQGATIQQEDVAMEIISRHEDSAVARFSRKIQQKRKRSSSRLESAGAKQLTTYEELRELDVNC
ncbi:hypothetical protein F511_06702 [Dorcoceras hygrometricum]|uniref:Uncharacterized protein n=1 Tax=Dorcoceras hygrometricum TaxID=472368 RepID=A0A2Z7B351_9LAMI|nr:hypothetical protein F511_06702 [Dorcoceras hygrometricum]